MFRMASLAFRSAEGRWRKSLGVVGAALAALAGCVDAAGPGPSFDPATDFTRYGSYSWPADLVSLELDAAQTRLVRGAIDQTLAEKGYGLAAEGDLVVTFTATLQSLGIPTQRYATRPSAQFRESPTAGRVETVLTLAVSVVDGASSRSVWQNTESLRLGGRSTQEIRALARAVMAEFPSK